MHRFITLVFLEAAILGLQALPAFADSLADCETAIAKDDRDAARAIAEKLKYFNTLSSEDVSRAEACLSFGLGEPHIYSMARGRFVSASEHAQDMAAMEQRRQTAESRRQREELRRQQQVQSIFRL